MDRFKGKKGEPIGAGYRQNTQLKFANVIAPFLILFLGILFALLTVFVEKTANKYYTIK